MPGALYPFLHSLISRRPVEVECYEEGRDYEGERDGDFLIGVRFFEQEKVDADIDMTPRLVRGSDNLQITCNTKLR